MVSSFGQIYAAWVSRAPSQSCVPDRPNSLCARDAVHPTLPYLSQGAGISLEDAAVLGHILAQRIPLSEAIVQYEALRRPRTTKIVAAATAQQYWYHLHDGEAQKHRDTVMGAEVSCEGDPFLWREPTFAPWLYGYDAYAEAEKAVEQGLSLGFANGTAN